MSHEERSPQGEHRSAPVLTVEQVMSRVVVVGGCWVWRGPSAGGYGVIRQHRGRASMAHRVMYESSVGPIPSGLVLDHLCRNRLCVKPSHLEPVTNAENILRGHGAPAENARKTHCRRGHELSGTNVRIELGGRRRCRSCERIRLAKEAPDAR